MTKTDLTFLAGGGEMGKVVRAFDWSSTALGAPESWPQSLKTTVATLLNSRHPMFLWWGPELIQFYNDGYRPSLGSTKHPKALGQRGQECWPEIWEIIGPQIRQVMTRGEATWHEDHLVPINRDNRLEEVFWTYSYSPIREESGAVGGVLVVCSETTGRVVGERRLRTLGRLAGSTRSARTALSACTLAGEVLVENPQDLPFAAIYLADGEDQTVDLVARVHIAEGSALVPPKLNLLDAAYQSPVAEAIAAVGSGSEAVHLTGVDRVVGQMPTAPEAEPVREAMVLPIARQGQTEPAGVLVAGINPRRPLDEDYGRFLELVADGIARSIADARAYESESRRAEALAALDKAKTTFFSNVSHELRTPLTLMLAPLEDTLGDESLALSAQATGRLELVHRNAVRLLKLVNSLLDFSRIEAGRIQAVYQKTDLMAFTADLASVFRSAVEREGMQLNVPERPISASTYVDRGMWEKIVLNLLSNAFKHTFEGEISVELTEREGEVTLAVRDTGTGIPEAELPLLFERFRRVEGHLGRSAEGTGIGLALVQELVRLHHGRVEVTSIEGKGSTFLVTIPTGTAHLDPARIRAHDDEPHTLAGAMPFLEEVTRWIPGEAGHSQIKPSAVAPRKKEESRTGRIILADDNQDMRTYVGSLLEQQGYEVEAVSTGLEALRAARRKPPALILSDIMMPQMTGLELVDAVRRDSALQAARVILVSARAGDDARVEGLKRGADAYIEKPFPAGELLAQVAAQIEISRVQRFNRERLTRLFRQAPVAVAVYSVPDLKVELFNPRFQEMTGRVGIPGQSVYELFPELPADSDSFRILREVAETGVPHEDPEHFAAIDRNGTGVLEDGYYRVTAKAIQGQDGTVQAVMVMAVDTTEEVLARRRVQALIQEVSELNESLESKVRFRTEQLRLAASRLTMAEQEERRRISGILHDGVQQLLVGAALQLDHARSQLDVADGDGAKQTLEQVGELLQESIGITRRLTVDLSPPILRSEGLTEALRWLGSHFAGIHDLEVDVQAPHSFRIEDEDLRVLLFQTVRELLFNVVKHAGVDSATVRIYEVEGAVRIEVRDEGRGFDPGLLTGGSDSGFGLYSIRERLTLFEGRLDVDSQPGGGTTVAVEMKPETQGSKISAAVA